MPLPWVTWSLLLGSVLVYFISPLSDLLIYDRGPVLRGDFWRLLTAPLVHFSGSHLFWNLLILGISGWFAETVGRLRFGIMCGLAALAPGLYYIFGNPQVVRYGGLSGLATGAVVLLCFSRIQRTDKSRNIWIVILGLVVVKLVVEYFVDRPIFSQVDVVPLPSAHLAGILGAIVAFLSEKRWNRHC